MNAFNNAQQLNATIFICKREHPRPQDVPKPFSELAVLILLTDIGFTPSNDMLNKQCLYIQFQVMIISRLDISPYHKQVAYACLPVGSKRNWCIFYSIFFVGILSFSIFWNFVFFNFLEFCLTRLSRASH